MQLNDSELKKLIEAVIVVLKAQGVTDLVPPTQAGTTPKDVFVLFTAPWDNRFYTFSDELKHIKNCRFTGLLSPDLPPEDAIRLGSLADWNMLATWERSYLKQLENSISVFPVTGRNTIVKTALCIGDTWETGWIQAAMAQGSTIVLPRNGFERFTGREPESYKQKILSYYRDLLQMDIALPESFEKYMR